MKKKLARMIPTIVMLFAMLLTACSGTQPSGSEQTNQAGQTDQNTGTQQPTAANKGPVTVGGKDFTEQHLLSKITSVYLKEKGYEVKEASNMGSTVVRSALENGQIDVYWEYTGTALVIYQKQQVETDPDIAYEKVKEADKAKNLVWLDKANFNNTYAILMRKEQVEQLGIDSISKLAKYVNANQDALKFASNAEFYAREDGIKGLEKKYGFKFPPKNVVKMDTGLLYNALKEKQVDVSVGFATDGRIKGFDLVALFDDQSFFPAYNGAPVVRQQALDKNPELKDLLNELANRLDTDTMMKLNFSVDVEHKDVAEVAREWLVSQQLIK